MRRTERPVQTRFRCAYTYRLKLARHIKSLTHYTKGTPSPVHQKRTGRKSNDEREGRHGTASPFTAHCLPFTRFTFGEPAPTVCRHPVSGTVSLPLSGCFSPFPHGTGSLSVMHEYLGLEGGPPAFRQDFTCPALLKDGRSHCAYGAVTRYGHSFQNVPLVFRSPLAWSAFARRY